MQEIGGAVERIDDPDELTVTAAARFLAEYGMLRMAPADRCDNVRFGFAVDVRHEIVAAFGIDFDRIETRQAAHDQITGAPGGAHSDIEQWLHKVAVEYQSMTALVRIVLIDPSHPGNIGSVARAMKNMGVTDLVLVRPRSFPHAESNALAAEPRRDLDRTIGNSRRRGIWRGDSSRCLKIIARHCCSARSATDWAPTTYNTATCWFAYPRIPSIAR